MISVNRLKECFSYSPDTGLFTRLIKMSAAKAGEIIGNKANSNHKYALIAIDGKQYYAHRLAWLYMIGFWPKDAIDHINCNPLDNRFVNLREATQAENCRNRRKSKNNTTGYKGITRNRNGYMVRICIGTFENLEEAAKIYETAVKIYHKEFARVT